jgi:hypothetical protein
MTTKQDILVEITKKLLLEDFKILATEYLEPNKNYTLQELTEIVGLWKRNLKRD